jgi:signal transduction histidine kinase
MTEMFRASQQNSKLIGGPRLEAFLDITRLTRLISILNDSEPLHILLDRCLSALSELFLADIVVLLDPAGTGSFSPLASVGLPEEISHLKFSEEVGSITQRILAKTAPFSKSNIGSDDPDIDLQLRQLGARHVVGLPVYTDNAARGVLILARCHPLPFSEADIGLAGAMAKRVCHTLVESQREYQLKMLLETSPGLGNHLEEEVISAEAARTFPRLVGADAAILVWGKQSRRTCCAPAGGLTAECSSTIGRFFEFLVSSKKVAAGRGYLSNDIRAALAVSLLEELQSQPIKALIAVPLCRADVVEGLLLGLRFSAAGFPLETLQVAVIYGEKISAALENAALFHKVTQANCDLEKRVEERTLELRKAHGQLLHAEKLSAIGSLSASIAHEFNNPLQSVMTVIKGIHKHSSLDENEKFLMDLALKECQRMRNLIKSLHDFNRPSSGKWAKLDIHQTIESVLHLGKYHYGKRGITVVKDYGIDLPHINAVADQVKQVLLNLLNNACDACEDSGGTITISTATDDAGYLKIAIRDSGKGIPPELISKLFEPFFTTKPESKGTGLGLSVCHDIVKKHGGRIEVESALGRESLFTVFLPITGPPAGGEGND